MKPLGMRKARTTLHGEGCPVCVPMIRRDLRRSSLRARDIYERRVGRARENTRLRREARDQRNVTEDPDDDGVKEGV